MLLHRAKIKAPGFSPTLAILWDRIHILHRAMSHGLQHSLRPGFMLLSFVALQLLFLTWDVLALTVYLANMYEVLQDSSLAFPLPEDILIARITAKVPLFPDFCLVASGIDQWFSACGS